ncbi:hypothetical protein AB205_0094880, partial [Aquarana catesbeiana]
MTHVPQSWSRKQSPVAETPTHSLIPEINNDKILEVTNKIIELLTEEVPIRCQVNTEEGKYLYCNDLPKETVMENRLPFTSPDGSSDRNPPERCPHPLYSRDSTQEHQEIPQEDQCDNQTVKAEDEAEMPVKGGEMLKEEEISIEISTDPGATRATQRDVKAEEDEGRVRIKEEEMPIEISTDPGATRAIQGNVKAEEEEEGHVRIKEEEVPFEIGT